MYGSVPYSKDESYRPLRAPKNAPVQSKLSADAPEFVFPAHVSNNAQLQHQQYQQLPNQLDQSQQHQQPLHQQQQHQPQHNQYFGNSSNGYQQRNSHYHHHHHVNHNNHHRQHQQQHHPQQQQQQHYQQHHYHGQHSQRLGALANDVQDRLKINSHSANRLPSHNYQGSQGHQHRSNNSYPNQSQQSRLKFNNYPSTSSASAAALASAAEEVTGNDCTSNTPDMETVALDYLGSVIQCLNSNPGQYDTVATRFLNIFEGLENNQFVLSIAMEDIFNESTQNPNFRYMGAKLYHLLHMLNLKKDSLFLTLLKCKLDDFQREVREYMEQSQHGKVREATLFLAELYMQLRGDDSRIQLLAENIVFSLKQLLGSESPDNVRCICLTLKLAGYDLTSDCKQEIAEIISYLHNINERSPGKYPIIASVLTLSRENWGRKLSSSVSFSESECMPEPLRSSDEPIFYGPDGRELTAEETDFLTGGLISGPGGSTDEDDDADLDEFDLEMDEEASKAYKEFCKRNASS